jgi:hypothetical protein
VGWGWGADCSLHLQHTVHAALPDCRAYMTRPSHARFFPQSRGGGEVRWGGAQPWLTKHCRGGAPGCGGAGPCPVTTPMARGNGDLRGGRAQQAGWWPCATRYTARRQAKVDSGGLGPAWGSALAAAYWALSTHTSWLALLCKKCRQCCEPQAGCGGRAPRQALASCRGTGQRQACSTHVGPLHMRPAATPRLLAHKRLGKQPSTGRWREWRWGCGPRPCSRAAGAAIRARHGTAACLQAGRALSWQEWGPRVAASSRTAGGGSLAQVHASHLLPSPRATRGGRKVVLSGEEGVPHATQSRPSCILRAGQCLLGGQEDAARCCACNLGGLQAEEHSSSKGGGVAGSSLDLLAHPFCFMLSGCSLQQAPPGSAQRSRGRQLGWL